MNLVRILLPSRIAVAIDRSNADIELDPLFTMFYAHTRNPPVACFLCVFMFRTPSSRVCAQFCQTRQIFSLTVCPGFLLVALFPHTGSPWEGPLRVFCTLFYPMLPARALEVLCTGPGLLLVSKRPPQNQQMPPKVAKCHPQTSKMPPRVQEKHRSEAPMITFSRLHFCPRSGAFL